MLDLRYSGVTSAGVQAFRAAVPNCKMTFVDRPREFEIKNVAPPAPATSRQSRRGSSHGGQVRMAGGKIQSMSVAGRRI